MAQIEAVDIEADEDRYQIGGYQFSSIDRTITMHALENDDELEIEPGEVFEFDGLSQSGRWFISRKDEYGRTQLGWAWVNGGDVFEVTEP